MGTRRNTSFITPLGFSLFLNNSSPSIWAFPLSLDTLSTYFHCLMSGGYQFCCPFLRRRITLTALGLLSELKLTDTTARGGRHTGREGRQPGGDSMVTQKQMNLKHDKRAGSYLPSELPCLGKQALALARRETCQGLICVFVHRCASKHTRTPSHDHQKRAIVKQ